MIPHQKGDHPQYGPPFFVDISLVVQKCGLRHDLQRMQPSPMSLQAFVGVCPLQRLNNWETAMQSIAIVCLDATSGSAVSFSRFVRVWTTHSYLVTLRPSLNHPISICCEPLRTLNTRVGQPSHMFNPLPEAYLVDLDRGGVLSVGIETTVGGEPPLFKKEEEAGLLLGV